MHRVSIRLFLAALALAAATAPVSARSLRVVQASGTLGVCAHPNSLPYASRTATPPGFQIELGKALAERMHLGMQPDWVLTGIQIPRADCDVMLDVIADPEAQGETHMKLSKPYYRNGMALVVPKGSKITGFDSLDGTTKVGVAVGSIPAMVLNQKGVAISIFGFEEEMIDAVATGEVAGAVVTPIFAGWYLKTHPNLNLVLLPVDTAEPRFHWNVAVGMRKPDADFAAAVDAAMASLTADGTVARIYASYGVTLPPLQ